MKKSLNEISYKTIVLTFKNYNLKLKKGFKVYISSLLIHFLDRRAYEITVVVDQPGCV